MDAALAGDVAAYVQPTVTFVYPSCGPVSEDTPVSEVPAVLRSTISAEREADDSHKAADGESFSASDSSMGQAPGTTRPCGARCHPPRRRRARALLAALILPSGIYNVCRDGERISNHRFTHAAGWHPSQ